MRILAIETTTPQGSVALLDGGEVVSEVEASVPQRHLEWLAPAIADLLDGAGWRAKEIEGIAVSIGPGTFTGLRIGIATAAAWAYARAIPVVGVSTLEVLAEGTATMSAISGLVCPVVDARRGELAFALFACRPHAARVLEDAIGPGPALLERMPSEIAIAFTGDGVPHLLDEIHRRRTWSSVPASQWYPRAAFAGIVGSRRLDRGERDAPHLLRPVYARAAGITPSPWIAGPGVGAGESSPTGGKGPT